MPETINASELPIVGIFNNNYRFEIPDYQRPYSWTTEQTSELLDDISYATRHVEDVQKVADASPYFLGSIVIVKDDGLPQADIVDGQQRITTLTIMLCVLRELAKENSDKIDNYIRTPDQPFAGIKGHFRLSIRERDNDFFKGNIQEMGKLCDFLEHPPGDLSDSRQRMFENANHLYKELSELDQGRRNILTAYLIQRCYLVVVSTSDQGSAYRIFSVLNDRGLNLSPTDILKANIIGETIERSLQSEYAQKWEDIEDDVGRDNFRDLFAHIRMIYVKNKLRGTLQQEFEEEISGKKGGVDFIDNLLVPYAAIYKTIITASYQGQGDYGRVNEFLRHLIRLDNFDWIPPAMAFFKCNPNDTDALLQLTQDLERLAYSLFIRRANINERINRYAEVLRAVERGDVFSGESPLQLSLQEKTDLLDRLNGQIYSQLRVRKPLLLRLDSLLADGGATYDHPIITIEHVLPQNPPKCSQWREWFPDDEEREQWTHKLANLVLLSKWKNSSAQNYEFDHKKNVYFNQKNVAPFALTTQVLNTDEWTPDVLECRQKELMDTFEKEWRLG